MVQLTLQIYRKLGQLIKFKFIVQLTLQIYRNLGQLIKFKFIVQLTLQIYRNLGQPIKFMVQLTLHHKVLLLSYSEYLRRSSRRPGIVHRWKFLSERVFSCHHCRCDMSPDTNQCRHRTTRGAHCRQGRSIVACTGHKYHFVLVHNLT